MKICVEDKDFFTKPEVLPTIGYSENLQSEYSQWTWHLDTGEDWQYTEINDNNNKKPQTNNS